MRAISLMALIAAVSLNTAVAHQTPDHAPEGGDAVVAVPADAGEVWPIFGLEIVGKLDSEDTGGQYAVIMNTTPPGGGPPMHVHSHEDEFFYVMEGTYEFLHGEESVTLSEGGVVHLPRGIPHTFKNVGDTPGRLLNTITPGGFENFFREIDALPKDQPLDREAVGAIAAKYGLRFLPPRP